MVSKEYNFKKIEQKWQKEWEAKKIFHENPDKRKKFFVNVPYPYMNAVPHIGHFYTYMRIEALARYKRLKGYNVLFPQAWHCTGSPIVAAARRIQEGEGTQIQQLREQGFNNKEIEKLKDPKEWTKVFPKIWEKAFKQMGISYDDRRSFITTELNPYYDKFVRWQFNKLREKGLIEKGKHPVVWDPKTNMPVGDHDRIKGEGETPQEFVLLKFKFNGGYLVAATLRPETIYGQTNLWIKPETDYIKANVNDEVWIVSKECTEKLREQEKKVSIIEKVKGKELIGKHVTAPEINRKLIILPSNFIDPAMGTGIVTSVPSDAPYDYVALRELQDNKNLDKEYGFSIDQIEEIEDIEIIPIIKTEKYGDKAAVHIVEKVGIVRQDDSRLNELTQGVYKEGYYKGIMLDTCGKYSGMKVIEAKEKIKEELIRKKEADLFYELTGEVISRSMTKCIVKIVSDQWFIKYGDKNWKKKAHEALDNLNLYPELTREQFANTIDWLNDWACTREYGLGTKLPFDEKWLIESLSDSTIYMAYYTIAHLIEKILIEKISDGFFDYIFLNKKPKLKIKGWEKLKEEFEYWYPFDMRNSGKDLIQNHLTFCLFNHVAIFPKKYWPRSFGVNGWVRVEGQKMSKSLGNMIPLTEMAEKFGADVSRLTILNGGEGLDDPNWDSNFAKMIGAKLESLYKFAIENYDKGRKERNGSDAWMESELNKIIKDTGELMEKTLFRSAIQRCFFDLQNSLKRYLLKGEPNKEVINRVIETQILLLSPYAPFICEEIWENIGKKRFVSLAKWPEANIKKIDEKIEKEEEKIDNVLRDIIHIKNIVKQDRPYIYIYPIPSEEILFKENQNFLANLSGSAVLGIIPVKNARENPALDPEGKSKKAKPGKPGIYISGTALEI